MASNGVTAVWCGGGTPRQFGSPIRVISEGRAECVVEALVEVRREAEAGRWAVGFVSYGASPGFDPALVAAHREGLPLVWFALFDEPPGAVDVQPSRPEPAADAAWRPELSRAEYEAGIRRIREALAAGRTYQVNYTQRFRAGFEGDPAVFFRRLYRAQPGEYAAYIDTGRFALLCTSPELFFETDGETITTKPMKGTAARGRWLEEDAEYRDALRSSEKERAENVMIVDLMRSDLGRVAQMGSVTTPELFESIALPTVWQMTSTVHAAARPGTGLEDIFRAAFPPGSVTGAPKAQTMRIIHDLEISPRGVYCGSIGMVEPGGSAVFNVAIRTVVIDRHTGEAECGLGGGVTWDSTASGEYEEVLTKSRFLSASSPIAREFDLLETMRLEDGVLFLRGRHLERLRQSARYFGFNLDEEEIDRRLDELALRLPRGDHRVRLVVTREGDLCLESAPLTRSGPWRARLAEEPVDESDPFLCHKTTYRAAYDAHRAGLGIGDEVLLWNRREEVTEFSLGNAFYEMDGQLYTPPRKCGLLNGTMREELLARGLAAERVLGLSELAACTGIWHVNSVRGVTPVTLDGFVSLAARETPDNCRVL